MKSTFLNLNNTPLNSCGFAFAPSNMALCKYWGKRDDFLRLPINDSLSISLGKFGTLTKIALTKEDCVFLNGSSVSSQTKFFKRTVSFLNKIRSLLNCHFYFCVDTYSNIPIGSGLASSASGFAALTRAMHNLFGWNLELSTLSQIARICSGSATRSCAHGFVLWEMGRRADGLDSFASIFAPSWSDLRLGILSVSLEEKEISSTDAMQKTKNVNNLLYAQWPIQAQKDLQDLKTAILDHDFETLGQTSENNANTMHNMIQSIGVNYDLKETTAFKEKIKALRSSGLPIYYTQDAGPNLVCLFLKTSKDDVVKAFNQQVTIIDPNDQWSSCDDFNVFSKSIKSFGKGL